MKVRRLASFEDLRLCVCDWNALAGEVPFRRWEWLQAWWRHYGDGHELYLLAVEDDAGRLLGIAPFWRETTAARGRALRMLGAGEVCTDYLSLLTSPPHADAVAAALSCWLAAAGASRGEHAWDLLELSGLEPTDNGLALLVGHLAEEGCAVHRRPGPNCWRIDLPDTWEAYVAELSKSHRKQVRRGERRLETPGLAALQTADSANLERAFEILVDLHQRRRRALGEPGCFASPRFAGFLRQAASELLASGLLELHWLELAGRPAAAEFHLVQDGVVYAYQAGVEPELLDEEPGRLMNIAVLQRAISQGRRAFDFLRGDEPYKAHWRAEPRPSLELRVVPPRVAAQMRHGAWLAGDSVRNWIKTGLALAGMH